MNVYSKLLSFMSLSSNIISVANHRDNLDHCDNVDINPQSSPCTLSSSQTDIQNVHFLYDYFQQSDENETSSDEETKENRKKDSSNVETPTEEHVEAKPVSSTNLVCTNESEDSDINEVKQEGCIQKTSSELLRTKTPSTKTPSTEGVQILTALHQEYNNNINALQSQIVVLHYQVQAQQKQLKRLLKWVTGSLAMGFSTILFMFLKRFTLAAFIAGVCYMTCVQECMIKVAFTMMFHLISLDKTMKYCPDHYVLGMQALKQCYQQFQQHQQQLQQQHQLQQSSKQLPYANSCLYNKKSQHARSYEIYAR